MTIIASIPVPEALRRCLLPVSLAGTLLAGLCMFPSTSNRSPWSGHDVGSAAGPTPTPTSARPATPTPAPITYPGWPRQEAPRRPPATTTPLAMGDDASKLSSAKSARTRRPPLALSPIVVSAKRLR